MSAENRHQRQRHGPAKHLAEGLAGVVVGAAAVVLLHQWLRRRKVAAAAVPVLTGPPNGRAQRGTDSTDTRAAPRGGAEESVR